MSVWLGARPDVVGFADVPVPPTSHDVAHDVAVPETIACRQRA
jgi:hypothetical protein